MAEKETYVFDLKVFYIIFFICHVGSLIEVSESAKRRNEIILHKTFRLGIFDYLFF